MQKRNRIQYNVYLKPECARKNWQLLSRRKGYCLIICFVCCLAFAISCLAQSSTNLVGNDKKSPLLSLLNEHQIIIERQVVKQNLQPILQEDISNFPPIIGIKWIPNERFLIMCLSPVRRNTDFQSPFLKLYTYYPEKNRLTLRAQSDAFVSPPYYAITRYVAGDDTTFFFPLRAPKQFEQLSPVHRLVRGDLFVQPIRTIFQSAVLENALFAVIGNGDDETQKLSVLNGKKQLKAHMKLPIALPDNYLDIEIAMKESTLSGILGAPIERQPEAAWRFKQLWIYQLLLSTGYQQELSADRFREIKPILWLKGQDENKEQANEEISFGLPVFGSLRENQILYWQHRKLSSSWEGGESLTIHELVERKREGETRLIDILIEYNHGSERLSWSLGKHGKLIQVPLQHTPMVYKRLNVDRESFVSVDPTGKLFLYTKGNKLIGLASK